MATPAVGEDIEALCGRCGQVWHVVMAKMGDRIAKVVCKRCGGHHRFRTESDAGEEAQTREGRRPTLARRSSRPHPPAAPVVLPPFNPDKPPRPYAAKDAYVPGDRVSHPTFGSGVVASSPGPGKVEIAFSAGMRVLACAKAASTLARPVAVDVPIADRPPK